MISFRGCVLAPCRFQLMLDEAERLLSGLTSTVNHDRHGRKVTIGRSTTSKRKVGRSHDAEFHEAFGTGPDCLLAGPERATQQSFRPGRGVVPLLAEVRREEARVGAD